MRIQRLETQAMRHINTLLLLVSTTLTIQYSYALDQRQQDALKQGMAAFICSGDTSWLQCTDRKNIPCEAFAREIIDTCLSAHASSLKAMTGKIKADSLAMELSRCVTTTIKAHYHSISGACLTPPKHLQK